MKILTLNLGFYSNELKIQIEIGAVNNVIKIFKQS